MRYQKIERRSGSKSERLEKLLLPYVQHNRGTPKTFAIAMSVAMKEVITNKDVWRILRENNLSSKSASYIPGFAISEERKRYLAELKQLWTKPDQALFLDEKKFKLGETMKRSFQRGYSPIATRLPRRMFRSCPVRPILPRTVEVIGAFGVLPKKFQNGKGNLGICAASLKKGRVNAKDIIQFIEEELLPIVTPYPGPNSIIVLDNMPVHRANETKIKQLLNAKGAFLLWNPPNSPDLNPIEKCWDVVLAWVNRRVTELACGVDGFPPRPFALPDLMKGLLDVRFTFKHYERCFTKAEKEEREKKERE